LLWAMYILFERAMEERSNAIRLVYRAVRECPGVKGEEEFSLESSTILQSRKRDLCCSQAKLFYLFV
jgi:hypothetical protein